MWKQHVNDLPLYRKILVFSFLITFVVVVSTAGFTFYYVTNHLANQLTERAKGIASLWSYTIPSEDVLQAIHSHNPKSPSLKKLNNLVGLVQEKNAEYLQGYLMDAKIEEGQELHFLAVTETDRLDGIRNFSSYQAGNEFFQAFERAIKEKKVISSRLYHDRYGDWITAFQPITDHNGKVIAVLAVDVNASAINHFKEKIGIYVIFSLIIITILVYLTLRWGIRRVLAPVNEIISGINAVSSGNFNVKLNISSQSDMVKLGEKFNHMTSQLTVLFERLADTYKEFGSIPKNLGSVHQVEEAIGEMEKIIEKTKIQKELQRAEKMNAIGQLAAAVAHEIRNPMTVVRGFLQIFLTKDHLSETELSYIQLMIDELNRAEIIINDYLSLAKPDLEQIEKVDISDLSKKVADLMNTFAFMSKNISLHTILKTEVLVKGNQSELKQVIINIVKNGIESMRSGGVLTLTVRKNERYGEIIVTDTGIGMSPEEMERLGTAFYSLKEKGTGMGLMVCYQIVERMKGRIDVESEKGVGTTFKVCIPLWEEDNGEG
ncbi:two-component sensor histidine kinase [Bacillus sp. MUM 116]|uniref:sensor histidine kinase n=1 Tax=Bacillus sp. MUM 116 TaxID=1678002 RepID=UPI0008F58988|nr:ATP-binding protein [Bacillus sp. MUM 116]OIK11283.1 two-component sensor histidine kinase [Bacillus sp. MUM 116]